MMRNTGFLMVLAALLHGADIVLTYIGLGRGFQEGNPLAVWLMTVFGFAGGALILKTFAMGWTWIMLRCEAYPAYWVSTWLVIFLAIIPWLYALLIKVHP
jgi:hypothetical protein